MTIEAVYDLVCADTETTGLDSQKNEIVEITAIEFNLSGQIGKVYTTLCRPMVGFIPSDVTAIHGITYEMVKDKRCYLTEGVREEVAEFIGNRPIVGHNIIGFDLKFMRINVKKPIDTLLICRSKYKGGNKLKSACKRLNIKWDDSSAHRSEYDVRKTIELYCKMMEIDRVQNEKNTEAPMFAVPKEIPEIYEQSVQEIKPAISIDASDEIIIPGVIPSAKDKQLFATQTYSYSRINLFNQCPFKWYMRYIKGMNEPDRDYFTTGKICHKVAEWAGQWCYEENFKNKFEVFARRKNFKLEQSVIEELSERYFKKPEDFTIRDFADFLWSVPAEIPTYFPEAKHLASLVYAIDKEVPPNSYEVPVMPDFDIYNKMIEDAINYYKCSEPDIINDSKKILARFFTMKDFSLTPGDITLTEKKLVFDKDWKPLKDFYANNAFFRGIIDVLSYFGDYVIITDYKTSRKMMTLDQLKEDRQTMTYILLITKLLPIGSFKRMIVRIEYVRFGETVEYELDNFYEVADRAQQWINSSIREIESEMLKTDGSSFVPKRNEYCGACYLGEDGLCPLFNKNISGKLDDPFACSVSTIDDCRAAWKRIETDQAEISRLSKLCKSFVKQCEDPIKIDSNAHLDFYVTKYREYDTAKTLNYFLGEKKIDIMKLIRYVSITPTAVKELIEDNNLELTQQELNSISVIKTKSTFNAFTPEEAKAKGVINA